MAESVEEAGPKRTASQGGVLDLLWRRSREDRKVALFAAILRILIGFAFIPAGLKKVIGQPFAEPGLEGAFYDFVYAFHDTGPFYRLVGAIQLAVAALLMTQRYGALGAALMMPIVSAILLLVWSTAGIPTITTVTLMWLGLLFLLLCDARRWRALLRPDDSSFEIVHEARTPVVNPRYWARCGAAVLLTYFTACALQGGVYRPRGADVSNPGFYLLMLIATYPVFTWFVDRRWYREITSAPDDN